MNTPPISRANKENIPQAPQKDAKPKNGDMNGKKTYACKRQLDFGEVSQGKRFGKITIDCDFEVKILFADVTVA